MFGRNQEQLAKPSFTTLCERRLRASEASDVLLRKREVTGTEDYAAGAGPGVPLTFRRDGPAAVFSDFLRPWLAFLFCSTSRQLERQLPINHYGAPLEK
jgi:hypothetical protein